MSAPDLHRNPKRGHSDDRLIAAVDIGSNSIHMTLARVRDTGEVEVLEKVKDQARLAACLSDDRRLETSAIDRAVDTLKGFRALSDARGAEVCATATATLRRARNRKEFLRRACAEAGLDVEVISGAEEARLAYVGALHGLPEYRHCRALCVDVGGGSTDVVVGRAGQVVASYSAAVGAVVATRKWFGGTRTACDLIAVEEAGRALRRRFVSNARAVRRTSFEVAIATGGSIQRLARIDLAVGGHDAAKHPIAGHVLTTDALGKLIDRLASARTQAERLEIPGMDPTRADTLLGGAIIYEAMGRAMQVDRWVVSTAALRTGVIIEAAGRLPPSSLPRPPRGTAH